MFVAMDIRGLLFSRQGLGCRRAGTGNECKDRGGSDRETVGMLAGGRSCSGPASDLVLMLRVEAAASASAPPLDTR